MLESAFLVRIIIVRLIITIRVGIRVIQVMSFLLLPCWALVYLSLLAPGDIFSQPWPSDSEIDVTDDCDGNGELKMYDPKRTKRLNTNIQSSDYQEFPNMETKNPSLKLLVDTGARISFIILYVTDRFFENYKFD